MDRDDVYKVLDGEREYQEHQWGEHGVKRQLPAQGSTNVATESSPRHGVGEWLTYMEHYLAEARRELTTQHSHVPGLHMLRKAVALGIACFEQHGVPTRAEEMRSRMAGPCLPGG